MRSPSRTRIACAAVLAVVAHATTATNHARAQESRVYEIGTATSFTFIEAEGAADHLEIELPSPRLRLGVSVLSRILIQAEMAVRYWTRFEGDDFGTLELMAHPLIHLRSVARGGPYFGPGIGITRSFAEDGFFFADGGTHRDQLILGMRGGYRHAVRDFLLVGANLFYRHYGEAEPDLTAHQEYGLGLEASVLIR